MRVSARLRLLTVADMAECAPRHLRGVLVGLFQLMLVAGGLLACVVAREWTPVDACSYFITCLALFRGAV